jgi:hypothetical protein
MPPIITYLLAGGLSLLMCIGIILPRRIIKGAGLEWADFFIGVELCWASFGSGLVNLFNAVRLDMSLQTLPIGAFNRFLYAVLYLGIAFFMLLFTVSLHQNWESRTGEVKQRLILAGLSNLIGLGLFVGLIFVFEGIS